MKFINTKILGGAVFGFVLAASIAVVSGINTVNYVSGMYKDLQVMFEKDMIGQNNIQIARINLIYIDKELKTLILFNETESRETSISNILWYKTVYGQHIAMAEQFYDSKRVKSLFLEAKKYSDDYFKKVENLILMADDKIDETVLKSAILILNNNFNSLDNLLNKLDDIKQKKDLSVYKNIILRYYITLSVTIIIVVVTIIIRFIQLVKKKQD